MHAESIHSTPVNMDWSTETNSEYASDGFWGVVFPDFDTLDTDALMRWLDDEQVDIDPILLAQAEEWESANEYLVELAADYWYGNRDAGWPMMNYYYPIDGLDDAGEAAAQLLVRHLPLVLVRVHEQYGLALTGGGMDLSWEICEAFMACGQYPPLHFCPPPRMAGRGISARDVAIIEACAESIAVARRQLDWKERDIEALIRYSEEHGQQRLGTAMREEGR